VNSARLSVINQNRDGSSADGISDLILETKWRLLGTATNLFKLSARFDLKLSIASERLGLGAGKPDADFILIATRNWGDTYLDWNVGYTAVDAISTTTASFSATGSAQAIEQSLDAHWRCLRHIFTRQRGSTGEFEFRGRRPIQLARKCPVVGSHRFRHRSRQSRLDGLSGVNLDVLIYDFIQVRPLDLPAEPPYFG
jgi:hypothetical protein